MSFLEYAPAPESTSVLKLKDAYGLFIDGEFVDGSGAPFDTIAPATGKKIATVSTADAADIDRAVAAARRAYDTTWSRLSGRDRGKYLFRIARLVQERARELAVAESLDNGKPIKETRDFDIPTVAAWFFYYAGWADKLDHAGLGPAPRALGVAAQVIPWNFPLMMLAWKIAPALAAGNTVVLKPAETTPLTSLVFAEILQQADLPAGVVNIVTGAGETGAALVAHPGVDKVAFTGSTAVGKRIAQTIAGQGKKLTLELGGKGANIVFDDAPIEQAVEGVVNGIFFNQGQVCCAGSRLLVQESIHDEFLDRLKQRMRTLRVGDPLDKNTDIGAINSAEQLQRITALTQAGIAEGAEAWSPECELPSEGFWFRPTILTNVATSNTVARDEIFGPVLSVLTFRTPAEAVAKANNSPYGLSAGIWSEKGSRTLALADKLKAGVIWSNTFNTFDPTSPFGGYKESGYGREGGRQGIGAYLQAADAPAPARAPGELGASGSAGAGSAAGAASSVAQRVAKAVTKPAASKSPAAKAAAAKPAKTSTRKAAK
ncbi:aldehyde dehydrogenase family protein [Schumannella soli]|uniref:aldehyde dehydrogenase family protein n=1 Tax=Schumannella soli TaxID=2590779 RepID=UPI002104604C|nr:aldehyde dehydrogenase family protein [Schumannella soli]